MLGAFILGSAIRSPWTIHFPMTTKSIPQKVVSLVRISHGVLICYDMEPFSHDVVMKRQFCQASGQRIASRAEKTQETQGPTALGLLMVDG